jgi:hypothetical protein
MTGAFAFTQHSGDARLRTLPIQRRSTSIRAAVSLSTTAALARDIKLELNELDLCAGVNASGSRGVQIALPPSPKTAFQDAARLA